ncbi:hypothetical protein D9Q98_001789 [Chlorella vulgaris]|uniref:SHSP domain-containing protein n=1 Tax=Chlorella vulgaris TaxID=3077 RepID=A0A9D4TV10_CHLVU|nr:hypothetical protein D9Q98_001789 [Chlorella vulgaris]
MALLFHPEGPAAWQRDLFGYSSPFYYNSTAMPGSTYPCGRSASLSPRLSPAQAPAAGYTYRLAPPRPSVSLRRAVPEVHISRSEDGVLAQCPLGRSFTPDDMRLRLDGAAFTITAFHPGTEHYWPAERPVAFRHTLELGGHIDTARITARLEAGLLSIRFPYRRPEPQSVRVEVVVERPVTAPTPRPAPTPAPAPAARPAPAAPAPSSPPAPPAPASRPAPPASARPAITGPQFAEALLSQLAQLAQLSNSIRASQPQPAGHSSANPDSSAPSFCQRLQQQAMQKQRAAATGRQQRQAPADSQQPAAAKSKQAQASQPRTIPVEGPSPPAQQEQEPQQQKPQLDESTGPSTDPATATATPTSTFSPAQDPAPADQSPAEEARAELPSADSKPADKGKAPASPEQLAAFERQEAARRAAERIASGHGSDSDWEEAEGTPIDCPLDD